jgi:hypothetical protein
MRPTTGRSLACGVLVVVLAACGGSGGSSGPQVPGAPSGVTAAAGIRSAQLSWSAPAPDGGAAVIDYTVTASPGGATATVAGLAASFSGLANGTTYTFSVKARNAAGLGAASSPSAAVTTPDVPASPPDLLVRAGDRSAVVDWGVPAVNGPPVTGYNVTVVPPAPGAIIQVGGAAATVVGLTNGVAYSVQVVATNAVGDSPMAVGAVAPVAPACPSCPAGSLAGLAAASGPIGSGVVVVLGANGVTSVAATAADGSWHASVAGLTAPYLVKAAGAVGGRPTVLHSIATGADVATRVVNVTPFTELMAAMVLGGDPETPFANPAPNLAALAAVTDIALMGASLKLSNCLQTLLVLSGAGSAVGGPDLRTAAFAIDGTGLDLVLRAVSLSPLVDPATHAISYWLTNNVTGAIFAFDPAVPDGATMPYASTDVAAMQVALADLASIWTTLSGFASRFATALPPSADLLPSLAPAFRHNGLDGAAWVGNVLLAPRPSPDGFDHVGLSVTGVALQRRVDADTLDVSFGLEVGARGTGGAVHYPPWQERMIFKRGATGWLMAGNGRPGATRVTYMARIKELGLTATQLDTMVHANTMGTATGMAVGMSQTIDGHYYRLLRDVPTTGTNTIAWIGIPGDWEFGVMGWVGDNYDNPATPTVDERALRRQYIQYVGTPSGRISTYLILDVSSSQLDPAVARVVVTGPGLPGGGLALVRPPSGEPRDFLVYDGDAAIWNAFNTDRCRDLANGGGTGDTRPVIPGCGLDWSKVAGGTSFHFDFRDAGGLSIGSVDEPLQGRPDDEASWWARRASFPRFTLPSTQEPSFFNIFDDTSGAPWGLGGTVNLAWTLPADPTVQMTYVSHARVYYQANASTDPTQKRDDMSSTSLWERTDGTGARLTSASHTFTTGFLTFWAWSTLEARDAYGNALQQDVSPVNPR